MRRIVYVVSALLLAGGFTLVRSGVASATTTYNVSCGNTYGTHGLVAALDAAYGGSGGTVNLAKGCTYTLTKVDNTLDGPTGLPVIGNAVTINGNGSTIKRSAPTSTPFRIFAVGPTSAADLTLNKVTVTGGYVTSCGGGFNHAYGGGIDIAFGTVTLNGSTVSTNTVDDTGSCTGAFAGGIDNFGGTVNVSNSHVEHNSVIESNQYAIDGAGGGGVLNNDGGLLRLTNAEVDANSVSTQGQGEAGGIMQYIERGTNSTTDSTGSKIAGNSATCANGPCYGGGISAFGGTMSLSTTTVTGNWVKENSNYVSGGGGIDNGAGLTLDNSWVTNNKASGYGDVIGGGIWSAGSLSLTNTQVAGNTASGSVSSLSAGSGYAVAGGGIASYDCTFSVTSSNIEHNTASTSGASFAYGGGVYVDVQGARGPNSATTTAPQSVCLDIVPLGGKSIASSEVDVNKATASGSGSAAAGGGIYLDSQAALSVTSTKVHGNTATDTGGLGAAGGGIAVFQGTLTIDKVSDESNVVSSTTSNEALGGGLAVSSSGAATVTDSEVSYNSANAPSSSGQGGGIYNQGTVTLAGTTTVQSNHPNNCRPTASVAGCTG